MSVLIGHASISEKGTKNGAKGDQTGKEVCIRSWYKKNNQPWDCMAIYPDANVRENHARAIEAACANDYIGYGQGDRNTANAEAKAVNYVIKNIKTKCNTDCSALQNLAAKASGAPKVVYGSNGWTTSTMKDEFKKAGYIIITDKKYLSSAEYCVRGAIYVKIGSHTITGLNNGSKASETLAAAGISGSAAKSEENTAYVGKGIGTAKAKTVMNIRSGAGTGYSKLGKIAKGTEAEVLEIESGWYKIVWTSTSCGYAYTSCQKSSYYSYTAKSSCTSKTSKVEAAKSFEESIAGTYKVTANDGLNLRTGAGKGKDKITAMPKNSKVKCYGYYTVASGVKWLLVVYNDNEGYCSSEYLKKQ